MQRWAQFFRPWLPVAAFFLAYPGPSGLAVEATRLPRLVHRPLRIAGRNKHIDKFVKAKATKAIANAKAKAIAKVAAKASTPRAVAHPQHAEVVSTTVHLSAPAAAKAVATTTHPPTPAVAPAPATAPPVAVPAAARTVASVVPTSPPSAATVAATTAPSVKRQVPYPAETPLAKGPHKGCFNLKPGEGEVIRAVAQHFGNNSFLLPHPEGASDLSYEQVAQNALYEALIGDCRDNSTGKFAWVVDASTGNSASTALAASLGCGVAAFEPEPGDVQALETTRCVNDPVQPFAIFSALASSGPDGKLMDATPQEGRHQALLAKQRTTSSASNGTDEPRLLNDKKTKPTVSIALDDVFLTWPPPPVAETATLAAGSQITKGEFGNFSHGQIALLKVTPHRCCGQKAALAALIGARGLLKSGRVRCLATEMAFDDSITPQILAFFKELEQMGYALHQAGPLDLPGLEVAENGAYPLFKTDTAQLHELFQTFRKIQRFDERSGYRVYGDGLSLDRDGRYFDYTNFVVACRGPMPSRVPVRERARLRFRDGTWWPETNSTAHSSGEAAAKNK